MRSDAARVPLWLGVLPPDPDSHRPPIGEHDLLVLPDFAELRGCEFRGVGIDRLPTVLATGIDVTPTDQPIYASSIDKAWEYGGMPKVLLALDRRGMERTGHRTPVGAPEGDLAAPRARYPTVLESENGEFLWFTRLDASDPRAGSQYEAAYSWWIPGDPWETLRAIFVFSLADL